jgi:hypothetical protein
MVKAGSAPKTACAIKPAKLTMEMIFFMVFSLSSSLTLRRAGGCHNNVKVS